MSRDGPGFLIDLFFIYLVILACVIVGTVLESLFGRPLGQFFAVVVSILIVFGFLLVYYRVYLDERPLLGTASRTRFGILLFQIVLIGFVVGALFAPPNPFTQVIVAGAVIVLGVILSYWWVYTRNAPEITQASS